MPRDARKSGARRSDGLPSPCHDHIDHEYNFLLQIRGVKSITIFDRGVLSEEAIERFYRGEHRNLILDERRAAEAITFDLGPGHAVHVPVNAPHYVKNGMAASVSFSITSRE